MSVENELSEPHLRALGERKDAERTKSKAEKQVPGEGWQQLPGMLLVKETQQVLCSRAIQSADIAFSALFLDLKESLILTQF